MEKKLSQKEIQDLVKKQIIKEIKTIKEDDDDDLGIYTDFQADEFNGAAMMAAMKDIKASGDKFVPLGKSKFEKDLDSTEFVKDLERQKLNLPNDKKELGKIKGTLDRRYKHEKQFGVGTLNEWSAEEEGPQPDDAEYHYPKQAAPIRGVGKFNNIDWQILHETLVANKEYLENKKNGIQGIKVNPGYFGFNDSDLTDSDEGLLTKEELDLLENRGIIELDGDYPIISNENLLDYNTFLQAAQLAWEKGFDQTQINQHDDSEAAYFRGSEGGGMDEGNENIVRPKDAEGNDLSLKVRVEDIHTGAIGRVKRFGVDERGKLTVHIDWIAQFGAPIPKSITYPDKIVVNDSTKINEREIEEGMGLSHTMGQGQNEKPVNYPNSLERQKMQEAYNYSGEEKEFHDKQNFEDEQEVYLVIDNDFNRAHYNDLIGQTFEDAPSYAQVKVIKKSETPQLASEDLDYAAAEREFHDKEAHKETENFLGKDIKIKNMDEITNLIFPNKKRIQSVLDGVKEEIGAQRVINNTIAATDNMDTVWIFNVLNVDDNTVYLEFTGTAK